MLISKVKRILLNPRLKKLVYRSIKSLFIFLSKMESNSFTLEFLNSSSIAVSETYNSQHPLFPQLHFFPEKSMEIWPNSPQILLFPWCKLELIYTPAPIPLPIEITTKFLYSWAFPSIFSL